MMLRAFVCAALCGATALPLGAQIRQVRSPVHNWVNVWGGMYSTVDAVYDPPTASTWVFDDNAPAFGIGIERELSQGLMFGVEGSYSSTSFERRDDNVVVAEGTAKLYSAFATGRMQYGGAGSLGGFLKGMAGTFGYATPEADTNFDLALSTAAGLEYRFGGRNAAFLEWDKLWAYHEKEGIDSGNTGRHTLLRLGIRQGF